MEKLNKREKYIASATLLLIAAAYFCRPLGRGFGIVRSAIYIGLFAVWGLSLQYRVIQKQVRKLLMAATSLILFWVLVRTIKYFSDAGPTIARHLWYSYYIPMLFLPPTLLLIALSMGKRSQEKLPKWTRLLFLPSLLLFFLVFTNDLHQLVFSFPLGYSNANNYYNYEWGYFAVIAWIGSCTLGSLAVLIVKYRVPHRNKILWRPLMPVAFMIGYLIFYGYQMAMHRSGGDMTVISCLCIIILLETCTRYGIIQVNTRYREMFHSTSIPILLTDQNYHVLLSSQSAEELPPETMRQTEYAPVLLNKATRLSGVPIHGGYVLWQEDVSKLLRTIAELENMGEYLHDQKKIHQKEYETEHKRQSLIEKNRLYHKMMTQTAENIHLFAKLADELEQTNEPEEIRGITQKMAVVGAYIKRRNNLIFLDEQSNQIPARELEYCIRESILNLRLCDVDCTYYFSIDEPLDFATVTRLYDLFQTILLKIMDHLTSLIVTVGKTAGNPCLILSVACTMDLSELSTDEISVEAEEENEYTLICTVPEGECER
jgi:hypothetical protein